MPDRINTFMITGENPNAVVPGHVGGYIDIERSLLSLLYRVGYLFQPYFRFVG
jgi:hypothetical protein